jgi:hypothetical protein
MDQPRPPLAIMPRTVALKSRPLLRVFGSSVTLPADQGQAVFSRSAATEP